MIDGTFVKQVGQALDELELVITAVFRRERAAAEPIAETARVMIERGKIRLALDLVMELIPSLPAGSDEYCAAFRAYLHLSQAVAMLDGGGGLEVPPPRPEMRLANDRPPLLRLA